MYTYELVAVSSRGFILDSLEFKAPVLMKSIVEVLVYFREHRSKEGFWDFPLCDTVAFLSGGGGCVELPMFYSEADKLFFELGGEG